MSFTKLAALFVIGCVIGVIFISTDGLFAPKTGL